MKVADIMQKQVDYASIDSTIANVARLIFGRGINGVPVCKGKSVIGLVTESDILAQFFPSMQEYIEDPVHARDFEGMEKRVSEILALKVEKIMSKNPTTVTPDTPLLQAQSLMSVNKVGRLPVVDKRGDLVGILSKGDIFRAMVGKGLPQEEEEEFYDWLAKHYDIIIDWEKRLKTELLDLIRLFKKEHVRKIVDVTSSTGEHTIALAKKSFDVFGLERSRLMHEFSEKKKVGLPLSVRRKVHFFYGAYKNLMEELHDFDAAILLGNALPHVVYRDRDILKEVQNVLKPKNSLLVLQIINFDKISQVNRGLRHFSIKKTHLAYEQEHAFVGFYTKERGKVLIYNLAIFDLVGNKWAFKGIRGTPVIYIGQKEIYQRLKKLGFSKIQFYGSLDNNSLFAGPFKPLESDWLNVVAKR